MMLKVTALATLALGNGLLAEGAYFRGSAGDTEVNTPSAPARACRWAAGGVGKLWRRATWGLNKQKWLYAATRGSDPGYKYPILMRYLRENRPISAENASWVICRLFDNHYAGPAANSFVEKIKEDFKGEPDTLEQIANGKTAKGKICSPLSLAISHRTQAVYADNKDGWRAVMSSLKEMGARDDGPISAPTSEPKDEGPDPQILKMMK